MDVWVQAKSLPTRERGLKSLYLHPQVRRRQVAPHAGAWIEICTVSQGNPDPESLPTRERGLKSDPDGIRLRLGLVAPHAGAWIEIIHSPGRYWNVPVAPHAGAWIEIASRLASWASKASLPTRERGLKSCRSGDRSRTASVAPHAGAWIEICRAYRSDTESKKSLPTRERGLKLRFRSTIVVVPCSRSPRGSVD